MEGGGCASTRATSLNWFHLTEASRRGREEGCCSNRCILQSTPTNDRGSPPLSEEPVEPESPDEVLLQFVDGS